MRILALTNLYPSPIQPHRAPFNRHQFRMLADLHDLRVIAPVMWTDELAALGKSQPAIPVSRRVVRDGLTVDHPRYWYTPKILRSWYGDFFERSVRSTFRAVVDEFAPEIVFAPWAYPDGLAAVRLARQAGLPVVIQVHGSDIRQVGNYRGRLAGTVAALQESDGVIAVSAELAERVVNLGASRGKVRTIIDGVDRRMFSPGDKATARETIGLREGRSHLLFVGNLVPVKGIDVLLEACRQVGQGDRTWQLHIVGDGPLRRSLPRLAHRLGIGPSVQFHGAIRHEELPTWFRAADLFVLPSRSEGVPNVLLEAAASGLPFVASAVGGIPEIARYGASRLVPPEDPAALAAAITQMLAHPPPQPSEGPRERREAVAEIAAFLGSFVPSRQRTVPPSTAESPVTTDALA